MPIPRNHSDDANLEAPPRLVRALQENSQKRLFVPPTVDEAVLRAARRRLEKPSRPSFSRFFPMPSLTAALGLALALICATYFLSRRPQKQSKDPMLVRQDLNHDGRVDILDAFELARQLKSGGASNPALDMNGDGIVDQRDVEIIAARAVLLEKGGGS
jgi:hypothetical protein